ncbi:hypothetical protein LOTGIDRAFT_234843 [Lottia gigantea]|uniref:Uncharacterized protein n=1 Tax=Lottia gigantea TaxID=225164 RepID=V3ZYX4_LOTGI|nr:hypothetical protein LOTGIDRAFT_234843 [Lottia gigantea]ESO87825.1 hypothetical protein LOTGIDRAFT_234843 [Lottia gigantea]
MSKAIYIRGTLSGKMEVSIKRGQADLFIDLLYAQDKATESFIRTCTEWVDIRNYTVSVLNELVGDLDKHHKNVNIASLAGTSVSALGGVAVIGGLLFAPVTGGASAVLAIGGTIASLTGGVTAFGSSLTELGITHFRCKNIQENIDRDKSSSIGLAKEMKKFVEVAHNIENFLETAQFTNVELVEIADRFSYLVRLKKFGKSALVTIQEFIRRIQEVIKDERVKMAFDILKKVMKGSGISVCGLKQPFQEAMNTLRYSKLANLNIKEFLAALKGFLKNPSTLPKGVRYGMGALSAVFIVVDVWCIITTSVDIHKGSKSKVGAEIGEINSRLMQGRDDITELIAEWV